MEEECNPIQSNPIQSDHRQSLPTGPTGRHIIVLRPESQKSLIKALRDISGLKVASSADFEDAVVTDVSSEKHNVLIFEHLNVALIHGDPDQIKSLEMSVADEAHPVLSIEPEMYVIPFCDELRGGDEGSIRNPLLTESGSEYLRGYADAVQLLASRLLSSQPVIRVAETGVAATFADTSVLTWGLQAAKVDKSFCSGRGIRVAVLDTGFDFKHPDFTGRSIISASFIPGVATAQDGHGHGTHCIGTSCGPKTPPSSGTTRRYGIAYEATILVGKVLSDQGSGQSGWILEGMNWAIQNGAAVISMSLGSPVAVGGTYPAFYEQAAVAALNKNCLVVAAAGNFGDEPVGSPANCPSVMAVAAVNNNLRRASFSCIGVNPNGGEINIAGPGVNIFSSAPMSKRYAVMSGTSMATPHVSGCAALWAQWTGLRGKTLWQKLTSTTLKIDLSSQQGGDGLVQAPLRRLKPPSFPPHIPTPIPHPPFV